MQLLDYLIDPGRMPFPTEKELAKRIDISNKTIQLNIRKLKSYGFLDRETRRTAAGYWNSNIYHLGGLIEKVQQLEPKFQQANEDRLTDLQAKALKMIYPGRVPKAETVPGFTAPIYPS